MSIQLIKSLYSSTLFSGRELNNFSFELAGLAGARRVDPLEVIQSSTSLTKQERRRVYRRKCSARRGPPAVEPRPFNQPSFGFTDCESFTTLSSSSSSPSIFFPKN